MSALARLPYVVSKSKPRRVVLRTAPNAAPATRMRVFLHLCFAPDGTNGAITACAWMQLGLLLVRQQRGQDRHWLHGGRLHIDQSNTERSQCQTRQKTNPHPCWCSENCRVSGES